MKRGEEIQQALSKYVKNRGVSGNHIVDVERDAAFIAGAMWADRNPDLSSLWHNAREMPKDYPILCQDELSNVWVEHSLYDYIDGWSEYKEFESIIRWAYVADLLPKGGEK